jgi:ABC-type nitrate/sulfonate/bicarbonate transport system substrate-binding protein
MASKIASEEYQDKVKLLQEDEAERLMSRMSGKLPKRLDKDKLSRDDALALQMELEDERLNEWRERMAKIKSDSKK